MIRTLALLLVLAAWIPAQSTRVFPACGSVAGNRHSISQDWDPVSGWQWGVSGSVDPQAVVWIVLGNVRTHGGNLPTLPNFWRSCSIWPEAPWVLVPLPRDPWDPYYRWIEFGLPYSTKGLVLQTQVVVWIPGYGFDTTKALEHKIL